MTAMSMPRISPGDTAGIHTERPGRLPILVAALSAIAAVLGAWWAFGGDGYPFTAVGPDQDRMSVLALLPEQYGAGLIAVLGAIGVPAALATRLRGWSPASYRPLLVTAAVEAVVFGLLCTEVVLVILAGYALVLVGVPAFLVMLVAGAVRQRGTRVLLVVLAAVLAVVALTTGVFNGPAFQQLADGLAGVPAKVGIRPVLVLGAFLLGVGWAVLGVRSYRAAGSRCDACGRPGAFWTAPASAARWGRRATIVAALCPMPYALLRFTWLLPDPLRFGAENLDAEPGIRMFGLGLGAVAFSAGVVTLGLIRPWGEVWPRWMPVLAGRPVPVKAAVIPAATAATVLLVASPSIVTLSGSGEVLLNLLLFPFPLWGLALGLATAAYYYRRRTRCTVCHRS
jgi:hypothetical protein